MDAEEVRRLLRQKVKEAGSQTAFAQRRNVSRYAVCWFLGGGMEAPQPRLLRALGLTKKVSYEPEEAFHNSAVPLGKRGAI